MSRRAQVWAIAISLIQFRSYDIIVSNVKEKSRGPFEPAALLQYQTLRVRRYSPAAAFSASALSVLSQVISGSERPKCPNAAV